MSGLVVALAVLALSAGLAVLAWPAVEAGSGDAADSGSASADESGSADVPGGDPDGGNLRGHGRRRRSSRTLAHRLRGLRHRLRGEERASQEVQLLDGLAAALDAGLSTEHALHVTLEPLARTGADGVAAAGPWSELARAAREGQPLAPSWSRLARRTGSRTAASVARAWAVAAATGAPLASAVRSSAHAARERHRLERAVEAATAGARATATVLAMLPVAGVGLAALLGVGPGTLYGDPVALASAGAGALLLAAGHLTVRRMVRSVLAGVS